MFTIESFNELADNGKARVITGDADAPKDFQLNPGDFVVFVNQDDQVSNIYLPKPSQARNRIYSIYRNGGSANVVVKDGDYSRIALADITITIDEGVAIVASDGHTWFTLFSKLS